MSKFTIRAPDFSPLNGKVVVVTGSTSGIGLETVELLRFLGASVVGGDIQEPQESKRERFAFVKTDVTKWEDLVGLFKEAMRRFGGVDHVHANAGLGPRADYINLSLDENGDPLEPDGLTLDVNLKAVVNTTTLGMHYIRQSKRAGSVVITSSTKALQRSRIVDYVIAKHGTLGVLRGMHKRLSLTSLPIRINAVAPSWTGSDMVKGSFLSDLSIYHQPASAVARAVVFLMADEQRNGQLIHVDHGVYTEVDESLLLPAYEGVKHPETGDEDDDYRRIEKAMLESAGRPERDWGAAI
ncbi:putative 15-hydroxyprostaglandin dehydrogenase [Xylariaceae sp. FL1019]|nr:putative 15-hydroxyprostaglandin dehydrogenase [Xylariaceae sp. FL1019]